MATDTIYMTHIQSALSSIKVNNIESCTCVSICIPSGAGTLQFCIKLTNDNLLQQAVVDVMPANGDQPYSGFVTVGREPLCPIYKH